MNPAETKALAESIIAAVRATLLDCREFEVVHVEAQPAWLSDRDRYRAEIKLPEGDRLDLYFYPKRAAT